MLAAAKEPPGPALYKRPPSEAALNRRRMLKLIVAAEDIFIAKGYHTATMTEVAQAAGMSKKTVYKLIASKAELFTSLLAHHHSLLTFPVAKPDWTIADILRENLLCLGRFLLMSEQIAIVRLIMAEYPKGPDIGRLFHQKRMMKARTRLEELCLTDLARKHGCATHGAREMAGLLFGLALGDIYLGTLIGFRNAPTRATLEKRIRHAVELFLSGAERLATK